MKLIIVMPCYNEELVLHETIRQLTPVLDGLIERGKASECGMLFVDDGSKDNTWQIISEQSKCNKYVHGLKLSHNTGHQNALWGGVRICCKSM